MLWFVALLLLVLWLVGWLVFEIAGALIHLLLIGFVIVILYRLLT